MVFRPWYCNRKAYIKGCLSKSSSKIWNEILYVLNLQEYDISVFLAKGNASIVVCTKTLVRLQLSVGPCRLQLCALDLESLYIEDLNK